MNEGYWALNRASDFSVKEYDREKQTYLLFNKLEGPYYLIDRRALDLLQELHEPRTTQQAHDTLARAGIPGDESGATLAALEKAGVIAYSSSRPAQAGRLLFHGSSMSAAGDRRFRSLAIPGLGLFFAVLVHYIYLLATSFSVLTAVSRAPLIGDYLVLVALVVAFTLLHEAAHCCVHYTACGRLPGPISLKPMGRIFFLPVPRVNLNMTYLVDSRVRRMAVLGAGLGVDLLLLWGSFLMAIATRQAPLWVYLAWFCIFSFVFNAVPLWKSDGYYMLSEATGMPNLSSDAAAALRRMVTRKGRYRAGLALYGAAKIVFETAILVVFLVIWYKFASMLGTPGKVLFWGIFAVIFLTKFAKGFAGRGKGGNGASH
ncbi:hypothetical protein IBX73_07845 [candidate division WOR-3 bacterium]|nr:hypothetical protein [candidate division WOR-3 bacterium]